MTDISNLGISGILGLSGCYLIVASILGHFIQIGPVVPRSEPISSIYKRLLLATFGAILAIPTMHTLYAGIGTARLIAPDVPDKLSSLPRATSQIVQGGYTPASLASRGPSAGCSEVESFGIDQRGLRELRHPMFKGEVYVYVGDIHARSPFSVYVFVTSQGRWPESLDEGSLKRRLDASNIKFSFGKLQRSDSLVFSYKNRQFRLTVSQVYSALIGTDRAALSVCAVGANAPGNRA